MARIEIKYETLTVDQKDALKKIAAIRTEMHYATLEQLDELKEQAEDLWWEHLTAYAVQYCQCDMDWWIEREYHEWKKFRKDQLDRKI